MFDNLSSRLGAVVESLRGRGRITEENVAETLRQVRMALLEADVALPVVKEFIDAVKARAVGLEIHRSLTPGQALVRVIHEELVRVMGEGVRPLNLRAQPPVVMLLAGLQGAGKTTTAAKIAKWLKERDRKRVLLVSTDVYRPAAMLQLERLGQQLGIDVAAASPSETPLAIATRALEEARRGVYDALLVDTAGRLHVDAEMMDEIRELHVELKPVETLFVVDSMTGQDAANTAKAFNDALPLTGVILTKMDGDARGGAALSIRYLTGKPIKFLGVGEKTTALEPFHPDRVASRILGMGDVLSLVEEVTRKVDREQAEKLAKKLVKGDGFTLVDFKEQLEQMMQMGGMASLMDKLPGMDKVPDKVKQQVNDREMKRLIAIVNSMTPQERAFPDTIRGSRKRRIAAGSGMQVQDVNKLLKQFDQMQRVMKKMKGGGMAKMMRGLKGQLGPGGLPGGGPPPGGFRF